MTVSCNAEVWFRSSFLISTLRLCHKLLFSRIISISAFQHLPFITDHRFVTLSIQTISHDMTNFEKLKYLHVQRKLIHNNSITRNDDGNAIKANQSVKLPFRSRRVISNSQHDVLSELYNSSLLQQIKMFNTLITTERELYSTPSFTLNRLNRPS